MFNNQNIEFDESSHLYLVKGKEKRSVTGILTESGVSDYDFPNAEYWMRRGQELHDFCTLIAKREIDWFDVPSSYLPLLRYFESWYDENVQELLAAETPLYNQTLDYCGKFDLLARLHDGRKALIEIKSGELPDWVGLQMVAYDLMAKADTQIAVSLKGKAFEMSDYDKNLTAWLTILGDVFDYRAWKGDRGRKGLSRYTQVCVENKSGLKTI
jgi:hypothetical protein